MNQPYGGGGGGYGAPPGGYGPPPGGGGYGAPPPQQGYAPNPYGGAPAGYGPPPMAQPMMPMNPAVMGQAKQGSLAVLFELLGGFFLQTFGIGHIYAGNVGVGLAFMFGYWALTAVNFFLCFLFIGFITWPICWLAAMIVSPILANNAVKAHNQKLGLPG